MQECILIIDNDRQVCNLLQANLAADYNVDVCHAADDALAMPLPNYALLLVSTDLDGDADGYSLLKRLKSAPSTAEIPFIILSERDSEDAIVRGFDAGADDYIVKPFSLREVVARIRSVIRRHAMTRNRAVAVAPPKSRTFVSGSFVVDLDLGKVSIDDEPITLSPTEYKILALLISEPDSIFSRDKLCERIWDNADVSGRTIDVNISRLRKKLGIYSSIIESVPTLGYRLARE